VSVSQQVQANHKVNHMHTLSFLVYTILTTRAVNSFLTYYTNISY